MKTFTHAAISTTDRASIQTDNSDTMSDTIIDIPDTTTDDIEMTIRTTRILNNRRLSNVMLNIKEGFTKFFIVVVILLIFGAIVILFVVLTQAVIQSNPYAKRATVSSYLEQCICSVHSNTQSCDGVYSYHYGGQTNKCEFYVGNSTNYCVFDEDYILQISTASYKCTQNINFNDEYNKHVMDVIMLSAWCFVILFAVMKFTCIR